MSDRVLAALEGGVLTATLNRPEKKNAIDTPMIDALLTLLDQADLDAAVRVVAVRGAGSDFCAGMDLNELLASADKSVEENRQAALRFAEIFVHMRRIPKPIVAVVQGRALAGGCGLATACDLVLATESAKFGYPEVQRGFVPAIVMTLLKRTAGEKVAFDLAATGRILGASEAAGLNPRLRCQLRDRFAGYLRPPRQAIPATHRLLRAARHGRARPRARARRPRAAEDA